jgi:UDP-N-acetylmuramoyl-tripeptide--D-alanyl-D-alanine ligase
MSMMRLSEAARAIAAELRGEDRSFDAVGTDTRQLAPRALFVALRGARFDGHDFLDEAAAAGAAAAMVEDRGAGTRDPGKALPLLVVGNTRLALGALAAHWRGKFSLPLVALTGSNGKTTVKEMLAAILREALGEDPPATGRESQAPGHGSRVLATRGNLNNDIGVPLTLLELRASHRYAVIEMGMNHAGEIRVLARLAAPDVALINNAGPAHIEFFPSVEAIARAKGEILEGLEPGGTAVINADDPHCGIWRELAGARRVVDFGIERAAAVTATCRLDWLESEIVVKTPRGEARARLRAPGLHNVRNALAASAAAVALDVPVSAIARGLARFGGIRGRLERRPGRNGAVLIDDTYNANPESARAAIEVLARAPGEKLLVLGDMGELGPAAAELHAGIGRHARERGIGRLLALGENAAHAASAFGPGARHYTRLEALLAEADSALAPGVTVLVKGSRFMKMERVVAALEAANREAEARP